MEIRKVAVLGAGLMGHGIAQVSAQVAGCEVTIRDVKQEFLEKGMGMIRNSLQKFVQKQVLTKEDMDS